jgi:hypothetical protein
LSKEERRRRRHEEIAQETQRMMDAFEKEQGESKDDVYKDDSATYSILIKIMTSFMQVNSLATAFAFEWPPEVQSLMSIQESVAAIGRSVLSVDCLAFDSGNTMPLFYLRELIFMFVPPLCVVIPALMLSIWAIITKYAFPP